MLRSSWSMPTAPSIPSTSARSRRDRVRSRRSGAPRAGGLSSSISSGARCPRRPTTLASPAASPAVGPSRSRSSRVAEAKTSSPPSGSSAVPARGWSLASRTQPCWAPQRRPGSGQAPFVLDLGGGTVDLHSAEGAVSTAGGGRPRDPHLRRPSRLERRAGGAGEASSLGAGGDTVHAPPRGREPQLPRRAGSPLDAGPALRTRREHSRSSPCAARAGDLARACAGRRSETSWAATSSARSMRRAGSRAASFSARRGVRDRRRGAGPRRRRGRGPRPGDCAREHPRPTRATGGGRGRPRAHVRAGRRALTEPLVLALLTEAAPRTAIAAGFEEEGVPLEVVVAEGSPEALAREAARRGALGLALGGNHDRLVLVLAAFPGRPYLEADGHRGPRDRSRRRSHRRTAAASKSLPCGEGERLDVVDDDAPSRLAGLHPAEGVVDIVERAGGDEWVEPEAAAPIETRRAGGDRGAGRTSRTTTRECSAPRGSSSARRAGSVPRAAPSRSERPALLSPSGRASSRSSRGGRAPRRRGRRRRARARGLRRRDPRHLRLRPRWLRARGRARASRAPRRPPRSSSHLRCAPPGRRSDQRRRTRRPRPYPPGARAPCSTLRPPRSSRRSP